MDEWELHFRNERLAAEREEELINDREKHGNTSRGTAQPKLSKKENVNRKTVPWCHMN